MVKLEPGLLGTGAAAMPAGRISPARNRGVAVNHQSTISQPTPPSLPIKFTLV